MLADALSLAHHCLLGPHHAARRLLLAGDRRARRALTELRERLEVERCDGLATSSPRST